MSESRREKQSVTLYLLQEDEEADEQRAMIHHLSKNQNSPHNMYQARIGEGLFFYNIISDC